MVQFAIVAALLGGAAVEDRTMPPGTSEMTIECPAAQTTRVVLPERVTGYRGDPRIEALLGLRVETRPRALVSVTPQRHPVEGRVRIDGASRQIWLVFRTVADGRSREIRLRVAHLVRAPAEGAAPSVETVSASRGDEGVAPSTGLAPRAVAAGVAASPAEGTAADPDRSGQSGAAAVTAVPVAVGLGGGNQGESVVNQKSVVERAGSPATRELGGLTQGVAATPARAAGALLDPGILTARVRRIGRVESLPGQRPLELVDLLEGDRYLWLRFLLREAQDVQVQRIWWEHGPIRSYAIEQTHQGTRLTVVVQLPRRDEVERALITKSTRVHIRLSDGERTFRISAPWLGSTIKELFHW